MLGVGLSTEDGQAGELRGRSDSLLPRNRSPRNSVAENSKHSLALYRSATLSLDLAGLRGLDAELWNSWAPQLTSNGPSDMSAGPLAVG